MIHIKNGNIKQNDNTAIMLGNFDGLHLGHQMLANSLLCYAKENNFKSVCFSFFPHPKAFFAKDIFYTIQTSSEKSYLLEQFGIDIFIEYPFDQNLSQMQPEYFVSEILKKQLNCKAIFVGEGYKFGNSQKGDNQILQKLGEKYGIKIVIIPHVYAGEDKVSSSTVRNLIMQNNFLEAEKLMSRPYFVMGTVAEGKQFGRTIGFPTVNVIPEGYKLLPQNGVYVTKTHYNGRIFNSITNVGINPTVAICKKRVETYIYDFSEIIYGKEIVVYFYKWLRNETKFDTFEQLKEQIKQDVLNGKC